MDGDVGHAWVLLKGGDEILEGGHSGELGCEEPKYFDGIMDLVECGDSNPVRYMWRTLNDGFFERGSGGLSPTYAIKKDLTKEQYKEIKSFLIHYQYTHYSLSSRQCISLVTAVGKMAGLSLESRITVPVSQYVRVGNHHVKMWEDPRYAKITLMSPDVLEKNMMEAVFLGEAEYALDWYRKNHEVTQSSFDWRRIFERLSKVYLM